jgi:hypothetical protein
MNSNDPTMSAQSNPTTASALPATPHVVMPTAPREKLSRGAGTTLLLVFGGVAAVMFLVVSMSFVAFLFLGVNVRHATAHSAATAVEEQSQRELPAPAPATHAPTPR